MVDQLTTSPFPHIYGLQTTVRYPQVSFHMTVRDQGLQLSSENPHSAISRAASPSQLVRNLRMQGRFPRIFKKVVFVHSSAYHFDRLAYSPSTKVGVGNVDADSRRQSVSAYVNARFFFQ
eukprot:6833745-Pyramimonas_sp.AAC.1